MGKSRAEIQKAYRERRALREGHAYRKKEVERVKKYYVPTSDLTSSARKKRRERTCLAVREHRKRRKAMNDVQTELHQRLQDTELGPCDSTTSEIKEAIKAVLLTSIKFEYLSVKIYDILI